MKKIIIAITVLTMFFVSNVHASSYTSTLNINRGTIFTGAVRYYDEGRYYVNFRVDGINSSTGAKSTTMAIYLCTNSRILHQFVGRMDLNATYTIYMGTHDSGHRNYTFLTSIYNERTDGRDIYDGVKSNSFKMYTT